MALDTEQFNADQKDMILEIIQNTTSDEEIRDALSDFHAGDIADAIEELDMETRIRLYDILGLEQTSEIISYLDNISTYLEELPLEQAAEILGSMDAEDAVAALEDIESENTQEELLSLMDEESAEDVRLIQSFEEDEIGYLMTTNYVAISEDFTVKKAMRALVEQAKENDNIGTIYVVDKDGKYDGAIDLKDLIIARDFTPLDDIISREYPSIGSKEKISESIERLKDYAEDSIPVLNDENEIIGVITSENLVDAVDDEMSDDYAKLAGLSSEEDLDEPLLESIKKRLPWLLLLLGLGLVVSSVVGIFEKIVAELSIVICFQSLILGMAGNTGTQSLAVTIRVLMDEGVAGREKLKLISKEIRIGAANGFLVGLISFGFVGGYLLLTKNLPMEQVLLVAGCVALSLLVAMVISGFVGTIIPIFFHKIKIDPAVASGPLITTINDLAAVIAYYGLVGLLLSGIRIG